MVKINKTKKAPKRITCQKHYQEGVVFETIRNDFYRKCYLCEDRPQDVHVEHFIHHNGNRELKYKWENLFYACSRCNNMKGTEYDDIIDCTKIDPEERIRFYYNCYPMCEPTFEIKCGDGTDQDKKTVELLEKIFCKPPTAMKADTAQNLCDALFEEGMDFLRDLKKYEKAVETGENIEKYFTYVVDHLSKGARFAAFFRTFARENYPRTYEKAMEKLVEQKVLPVESA